VYSQKQIISLIISTGPFWLQKKYCLRSFGLPPLPALLCISH